VDGYLLDTNVIIPLLRPNHRAAKAVQHRLVNVPAPCPVFVSVAAMAELYVGPLWSGRDAEEARREIEATISANNIKVREITKHSATVYGDLKARLMQKYGRSSKPKAAKWPEIWPIPLTGASLGVDEFDLLIIAHALEHNLVLVTNDEMPRIRDGIGEAAADLRTEDWTCASPAPSEP
jgi:predicted nucleic acid-binding protein